MHTRTFTRRYPLLDWWYLPGFPSWTFPKTDLAHLRQVIKQSSWVYSSTRQFHAHPINKSQELTIEARWTLTPNDPRSPNLPSALILLQNWGNVSWRCSIMRSRYIDSSSTVQLFRIRFCFYYQLWWSHQLTSELSLFDLLEVLGLLGGLARGLESDSIEELGLCSIEEWDGYGLSFDRLGIVSIPSQIVDE